MATVTRCRSTRPRLDLAITVDDGSDTNFVFDITGGGALFQLGPDVVSNQQARLGIQSLNTAKMGGASGRLYELASGGDKTLANDPSAAYRVVSEVISKVATLRGRLGAFQRTTVETNIASLNDTLVNLTEAESAIRDADFAKESSALDPGPDPGAVGYLGVGDRQQHSAKRPVAAAITTCDSSANTDAISPTRPKVEPMVFLRSPRGVSCQSVSIPRSFGEAPFNLRHLPDR